jgi:endonuclease/exonuclease/phosphatase family metal-dependent hydrolase
MVVACLALASGTSCSEDGDGAGGAGGQAASATSTSASSTGSGGSADGGAAGASSGGRGGDGATGGSGGSAGSGGAGGGAQGGAGGESQLLTVRVMAANTTSGNQQSYDPGEGIRIFEGLDPDIVLIQEFSYGDNSDLALQDFVENAFGSSFQYHRESTVGVLNALPNGVITRYPIVDAGIWDDPVVDNRSFVWARLDVPGAVDLWAVSVHLSTAGETSRHQEAVSLAAQIQAQVPATDLLVIGGDLNTDVRTEPCVAALGALVETGAPYPVDQLGNSNTSGNRNKPYDWLVASPAMHALEAPVIVGSQSYQDGLVFDSRVFVPLSDVAPVLFGDSGAVNMQHMAVVRDFVLGP